MIGFPAVVKLKGRAEPVGTGWWPQMPDLRDYTERHEKVGPLVRPLKMVLFMYWLPVEICGQILMALGRKLRR